jgi:hypothetical protein
MDLLLLSSGIQWLGGMDRRGSRERRPKESAL